MTQISLTKGYSAIIDDDMFDKLSKVKWHYSDTGYVVWRGIVEGKKTTFRMHRVVADAPAGMFVDHINRNPLDNRRSNLRIVSHLENMQNLGVRKDNLSGYPGVDFNKRFGTWRARLRYKKIDYVSNHSSLDDALKARKQFELVSGKAKEELADKVDVDDLLQDD